jgi:hypothetical protein
MLFPIDPGLVAGFPHALGLAHPGSVTGPAIRLISTTPVGLQENPGNLPGGNALQTLTNGIGGWALILSLVGLVVGAAAWALGSHSQNYQQSYVGRRTVLVSGLAALLIGAAPGIINFFFHTGQSVR